MVVDLKRFTPGEALQPGLLTVVETLPGGHKVADTTQELERGYWCDILSTETMKSLMLSSTFKLAYSQFYLWSAATGAAGRCGAVMVLV